MRRDDWMLAQLPVGMLEDDFFVRFVSLFQEVATGLLEGADGIDDLLDVDVTPDAVVRWLGTWIGIDTIDPSLPVTLQRRTVKTASSTLAWRGTKRGLELFLSLISRGPVEVHDSGGVYAEGDAPSVPPTVDVRVATTGGMSQQDFVTLVLDQVPAQVVARIEVAGRLVWPPVVPAPRGAVPVAAGASS